MGVKLGVGCGVSTLVGVKPCPSPKTDSCTSVGTGDDNCDLPFDDELLLLKWRPRDPLAGPDVFRALDLPLESAWESPVEDRGIVFLEDGDLDKVDEVIPWRGETRAGDRDTTRDPSLGDFLRLGFLDRETTSTPDSLPAVLVSIVTDAGMANKSLKPSPKVAVLEPLPAPLSGTEM